VVPKGLGTSSGSAIARQAQQEEGGQHRRRRRDATPIEGGWIVYARSTTVHGHPQSIDAGITHLREEIMPQLLTMDGCIGLSMLVDRTSGRCIVTTAWGTEDAMRASESRVRSVRDRAAEMLGGSPEVTTWEIAVLHRDHTSRPGACVRVTWLQTDPQHVDRIVDVFKMALLPEIEEFEGFCSASLLVDRTSGRAVASVTFDSSEAMQRTRQRGTAVRERGAREVSGEVSDVAEFDLALAHLRVPEMA
jgi:heme-degrading monooxygenase HmoA